MLADLLENTDGTEKMVKDLLGIVEKAKGIIVFGAGVGGAALYEILLENDLDYKIYAFSDNNELKFGKSYCNAKLLVIDPKKLILKYGKETVIIVASSAYDIIKRQLIDYGFDEKNIYLYNFAFMDVKYTDYAFIQEHIYDFNRAYKKLADKKSQRIFINILNYRITKNIKYLEAMQEDVDDEHYQYFDNQLFKFIENEVLLDVGAYTGDTFDIYNEVYKNWKGYIGLEADSNIFRELERKILNDANKSKVKLYNVAAWNENTSLIFSSNPGSSTLSKDINGVTVKAVAVDELDCNDATFIKMDIEGAEFNALSGMKKLIFENRPLLAICVYHLRDDYYKLTDFIENICPGEYKYYFRQYRYTPTETVCYAIPKNRR